MVDVLGGGGRDGNHRRHPPPGRWSSPWSPPSRPLIDMIEPLARHLSSSFSHQGLPPPTSIPRFSPATDHLQGAPPSPGILVLHRGPSPTSRPPPAAPLPPPMLRVWPRHRPPPGRLHVVPWSPRCSCSTVTGGDRPGRLRRRPGPSSPGWMRFTVGGLLVLCRRPGFHIAGMDVFPRRLTSWFYAAARVPRHRDGHDSPPTGSSPPPRLPRHWDRRRAGPAPRRSEESLNGQALQQ
jgi:hypothetical protein